MRNALVNTFARFRKDEKGVTLVEYGIALVLAITVGTVLLSGAAAAVNEQIRDSCDAMGPTNATAC